MGVEVANVKIRLPNVKIQEDLTSAFARMWEKSTTFADGNVCNNGMLFRDCMNL